MKKILHLRNTTNNNIMTLADLIKDLIDTSKERLKTPISGAFIFSFIIYNWRPIVELMFSKAAIEDRIYIINLLYCNVWAIIIPICMAFLYTIGVPMLMVKIDKLLIETKKLSVNNIYESKNHNISKKITFAKEELKLKDAESGNKEKQDYIDQIEQLKSLNDEMLKTHKNTVEKLKSKLSEANDTMSEPKESRNRKSPPPPPGRPTDTN
jgi:hypothetical protein